MQIADPDETVLSLLSKLDDSKSLSIVEELGNVTERNQDWHEYEVCEFVLPSEHPKFGVDSFVVLADLQHYVKALNKLPRCSVLVQREGGNFQRAAIENRPLTSPIYAAWLQKSAVLSEPRLQIRCLQPGCRFVMSFSFSEGGDGRPERIRPEPDFNLKHTFPCH